ncbi:MAG: carbamoyl phosphate synthase small subunit [Oscillospiraceae bacterium]|jgi:carbamoyl-phosphate synthase small subunit|nr:carbamoyl phosphate synthase small subunit [Oscillospiraceae bacterium]
MHKKAYLILENGKVFEGTSFGAEGEATGELVFTTAMTGYLETLTDPSFYGQIVCQTFPLIGNYGVIPSDLESGKPALKAYVVRQWCQEPSNFRSEGALDAFLKSNGIVALCGLDTRAVTRIVREHGVMNAKITTDIDRLPEILAELKAFSIGAAVPHVTCGEVTRTGSKDAKYRVALWDFGSKENISRELLKRGCEVIRVPADTTAEYIHSLRPDGVMLSNGPGDPLDNPGVIKELAALCGYKYPIFGICLGHQLLALSQGAKREKLKYGHRGANQPCTETATGRVYITSQNHGYAVINDSLPQGARASFTNANDGTNEGVEYDYMPAFTVQFHPEAAAGPLDTGFLFERFTDMMEKNRHN